MKARCSGQFDHRTGIVARILLQSNSERRIRGYLKKQVARHCEAISAEAISFFNLNWEVRLLLPTFVGIAMTLSGIFEMSPAKFPHQSAKMQISKIVFYRVLEIFFFHIPDVSIGNIAFFIDDEGGGDCIDVSVLLSNPFVTEDDRV